MILYPAIDLKDGKCIRLKKGKIDQITFYNDNPLEQAEYFQKMGAAWIHMVDIDGAFEGKNLNHEIFIDVKKNLNCSIQVGGGIRKIKTVEYLFENGINRIVLGTLAIKNPKLVKKICKMFPNKIALGVDAKNGFVASEGWTKTSKVTIKEIVKIYEDAGVSVLIFTDIEKDGVLEGVNIRMLSDILNSSQRFFSMANSYFDFFSRAIAQSKDRPLLCFSRRSEVWFLDDLVAKISNRGPTFPLISQHEQM